MKLILWHCAELRTSDIRKSDRPGGIQEIVGDPVELEFHDVLMVFACIEEEDASPQIARAIEAIDAQRQMLGDKHDVVVVPFGHLSSRLKRPREAVRILGILESEIRNRGITVKSVTFGYHKEFALSYIAHGHPGSVAFRSL